MPGVSKSSSSLNLTHCLPFVTPALFPVMAFLPPHKALIIVDFPVLGMPATIILIGLKIPFSSAETLNKKIVLSIEPSDKDMYDILVDGEEELYEDDEEVEEGGILDDAFIM